MKVYKLISFLLSKFEVCAKVIIILVKDQSLSNTFWTIYKHYYSLFHRININTGFERKKKTGVDADENHAVTEKTIAQTTSSVNEGK